MLSRQRNKERNSSDSSASGETSIFRKRPFFNQADDEEVSSKEQKLPDLQTLAQRSARFRERLSRMKVGGNRPVVQPKLAVGAPGDRYEQEADQMAAKVMSMAAPVHSPSVQKESQASGDLESRLNASKGGGSPLSEEVRAFMEPRFGSDFSSVRVHTGSEAVQMNRELGAQAFTHGSDVYFGAGKSPGNNELTVHELTHVMQQNGRIQAKTVEGLVQCKIVKIGKEEVDVANDQEEKEALAIIQKIKDDYGIDISSDSGVDAIKNDYPSVPKAVKDGLKTKEWKFKELQALERALAHFAPILGANRTHSSRQFEDQEITSASKVDQAIDADDPSGGLDTTTLGEYFESSKNFSMFEAGTNSTVDFKDNKKQLEGTAVHEIAHGLMKYALPDYVAALDYWTDEDTKSGKKSAEAPITNYGRTNAGEDLSEAVMYYFVEPNTLKNGKGKPNGTPGNPCPKRFAFIDKIVKDWKKQPLGDFPLPDKDIAFA